MQNQRLSLTSVGLLLTSLFLIFGSRIVVSHFGLQAVLSFSGWTPETLGAFTASLSVMGYVLVAVGAGLFAKVLYGALKCRFQFDAQLVKNQARKIRMAVIALACLVVVTSMFATTPVIQADAVKTTGYYLVTPANEWDYLLGNYTNGNIFAIRGSDWANLMTYPTPAPWASYTSNATQVWQQVLSAPSYGTIYAKEVAFPLTLQSSIPANVQVICNYRGTTYTYINSASSLGSPYTVSVGQGINTGYYLAQDSGSRICWSSTNNTAVFDSVMAQNPTSVVMKGVFDVYNEFQIVNKHDVTFDLTNAKFNMSTINYLFVLNIKYSRDITVNGGLIDGTIMYANRNNSGQGLSSYGSVNVKVNGLHVVNMQGGVGIEENSRDCIVSNCIVENASDDGISVNKSSNTTVIGNIVKGIPFGFTSLGATGIEVDDGANNVIIVNNQFLNLGNFGFQVHHHDGEPTCRDIIVKDNLFLNISSTAIRATTTEPAVYLERIIAEGNTILGANKTAIDFSYVKNPVIKSNVITYTYNPVASSYGIAVDYCSLPEIDGNTINGNQNANAYALVFGSNNLLGWAKNNYIVNATPPQFTMPIWITANDFVFQSNTIAYCSLMNTDQAILVAGANVTVKDNIIKNSVGSALRVSGANIKILNNDFKDNYRCLYFNNLTASPVIAWNTFSAYTQLENDIGSTGKLMSNNIINGAYCSSGTTPD